MTTQARMRPALELAVLLGVIVLWFLLIQSFGHGDVYSVMGPFACVVTAVCVGLRPRQVLSWFPPSLRLVALGIGVGAAMIFLTYPAFELVTSFVPNLDTEVQGLYHGAQSTTLPKALAWLIALAIAEEVLFRGVLPEVLRSWLSARSAYTLSLAAYALAQAGTGSWVVPLMAAGCGVLWTLLRVRTRSLLAPLCAHLLWSPTLILFYPVT